MEKQADAIISLLYEAALDSPAWTGALALLAETLHSVGASYFVWDEARQSTEFWSVTGHNERMQQQYLAKYASIDPTRDAVINSKVGFSVPTCCFLKNILHTANIFRTT
jgi:hypothetical protein